MGLKEVWLVCTEYVDLVYPHMCFVEPNMEYVFCSNQIWDIVFCSNQIWDMCFIQPNMGYVFSSVKYGICVWRYHLKEGQRVTMPYLVPHLGGYERNKEKQNCA